MPVTTAVGVIPARWEASRFPGKVLAEIAGVPMLRRVWEGARRAKSLREVIVATDDTWKVLDATPYDESAPFRGPTFAAATSVEDFDARLEPLGGGAEEAAANAAGGEAAKG